jgi:glycine/D-amino acid oxidase-like deaminating enzyme
MHKKKYDVVVIGAGIAGITTCHALRNAGVDHVALLEPSAPLGLTSDKSTECYRNFWPGPDNAMAALVNRSIDRLHDLTNVSDNRFQLHQRGYLFATANPAELDALEKQALTNCEHGGGPLRTHDDATDRDSYPLSPQTGFDSTLGGADLFSNTRLIRQYFPYLAEDTIGVLHTRRCGVLSAQQYGMYLFEETREQGTAFIAGEFTGVQTSGGSLASIDVTANGEALEIVCDAMVVCTGPHLKATALLAGTDLPVMVEPHVKISIDDTLKVIPRDAPLIVCNDPVDLCWTDEERELLAASEDTRYLGETFPAGVHGRPVGAGNTLYIYWTYHSEPRQTPTFPIQPLPDYPEILLRGMARIVPGLCRYLEAMPKPFVDGGYYTKVADNRPLIGPLSLPGTFVSGAYSGYGIMASYGGAELVAAHITGSELPGYAPAFAPDRFNDADYLQKLPGLIASGQI